MRLFRSLAQALCGVAVALIGLGPVGALSVHAASASDAVAPDTWQANDDDAWLFDLRAGQWRLGEGVRGYQTPSGLCVDLADMIVGLDLAVRLDKKSRRATGWLFDERRTLTIDRDAGEVQLGTRRSAIAATAIRDTPEGWCVDTKQLSAWLDVGIDPDLANAVLHLKTREKLPFELQAERKARAAHFKPVGQFELAKLPQASRPYESWQTPSVDVIASLAGIRDKAEGAKLQARYEFFASGEVLGASFDARLASDTRARPESLRLRVYRSDPKGELLGPLHATHVGAGDINLLSTGLVSQSVAGRGAVVTNRPLERPDSFDKTDFRGDLPTGWDAEIYRNGQLLGFAVPTGDGRYEFLDVPLLYGTNRFEIVLYGPQGQIRREVKQLQVGMDSIPPQKTYYWAGFAQEDHDLLRLRSPPRLYRSGWRGSVGVERGLNTRTSVSAYLHSLMIENRRRNYGEVALRRAIGPTLAEVSAAYADDGGFALRAEWLAELGKTHVRAGAMRAWGGFISDRLDKNINGIYEISVDRSFSFGRTVLPLHFDLRKVTRRTGGSTVEMAARTSVAFRNVNLTGQIEWRSNASSVGPAPAPDVVASLLANARFGKVRVRGEAHIALSGQGTGNRFAVVGEWAGSDRSDWRAEIGYDAAEKRARGGFGYTRRFDKFLLSAFGEAASDGSVAASINLAMSFGPKSGGGFRVAREKLASRGQVDALVWHDRNADGQRQADEPLAENVTLTAGHSVAEFPTDKQGRAQIDGLEPFRALLIGIDAGSLSDPYVQPALPGVVVTPRPGVATRVMLPLVAAGEIEGTLVRDGGGELEGVALELVDAEGRLRATTQSEYDGFFLFEGVAYGRYQVRIAKASAVAARLDAQFAVTADVGHATPRRRLGVLTLRRDGSRNAALEPADP